MVNKDTLPQKNAEKSKISAKIKKGELPLNHRELTRLLSPPAKWGAREIYIFRRHGQSLVCLLYPSIGISIHTQKLYPADTEDGQKVLLHGNKHLQRLIKKYNLIGKWVKIVYRQDLWARNRHKMKIYEVYDLTEKMKRRGFSPIVAAAISEAQKKAG
jgi:hypothetical protein